MHSTTGNTLSGAIGDASGQLMQVLPFLAIALGIVIALTGLARVVHTHSRGYTEGFGLIFAGAGMAALGILLPLFSGAFLESETETAGTPTPTPTATPTPTSSPEPVATPRPTAPAQETADLTPMFITLGIIAGLVLLAILTAIVVTIAQRARRSIRDARALAAARQDSEQRQAATWQAFRDRHDDLLRKILHAETDWDALFFTPALTDPNVPQTYAMLRAMRAAGTLRDTAGTLPAGLDDDADLTELPYPNAVEEFAAAWDAAERHARRVGQKGIPASERKTISGIRTLLDIAENSAASATERNIAYRRAQTLIAELESIHIPARAIAQLEEHHRLMLTAGQDA
jgi:hypothetical protein